MYIMYPTLVREENSPLCLGYKYIALSCEQNTTFNTILSLSLSLSLFIVSPSLSLS